MVERTIAAVCFSFWTLSTLVYGLGSNLDLEQNCILSFIVPRDKMKSSCELDEKVNRRINAIEMKVNIYKQEVADLKLQLEKERQLNAEKIEKLSRALKEDSEEDEFSSRLEKRLAMLEKAFDQLPEDMTLSIGSKTKRLDDKAAPEHLESSQLTSSSVIRTLIQTELNGKFENYTKRLETYVKEQVLFYNQLFRMLPTKNSDVSTQKTQPASTTTATTPTGKNKANSEILEKIMDVTSLETLSQTLFFSSGATTFSHSGITTSSPLHKLEGNTTKPIVEPESVITNSNVTSGIVLVDNVSEANDTFSQTIEKPHESKTTDAVRKDINSDISAARIGAKSNESDKANVTDSSKPNTEDNEVEEDKAWKENMIRDQHNKQTDSDRLRNEITAMLYTPLAEVFSVIDKKAAAIEEKIKLQEEKNQQVVKDLQAKLKEIDDGTKSAISQVESLSQGFKDSFLKMDKLNPLETLVNEIKKNLSADPLSKVELDEQGKKIKKLERLVLVYQQSLEHYRNESRQEYREVREVIDKNATSIKSYCKSAQENVTSAVNILINKLNNTYRDKLKEIYDQIRVNEDNVLLLQIDLSSFERNMKNKLKNDKEIDEVQGAVNELASKHRDFRKKLDSLESQQFNLIHSINSTAKEVMELKTEIKLNVLDAWLPLNFEYDSSKTECHGEQYVKKLKFHHAKLVGVVLCSPTRYKIFLSNSLHSKFLNVGDLYGLGEDHCEFVGAMAKSQVKLSPFRGTTYFTQGFARSEWGEEPVLATLSTLKPSPDWYECGLTIP
ncbi:hypothetical protein BgiMline_024020 [Biomphalaria glabrata]|uniref:Uncharacterized protein LOC106054374 n=1 Tax=Biomphalaria glabrata TaxID=6526 RepID=A0A9U8DXJ0_BIOGL|nr:uncharacterized protein LOC106054374 [Biomphalaria glabrata]KAI8760087.1 hypothetical protein BgiMline_007240 [Biomphalaria glabrata]